MADDGAHKAPPRNKKPSQSLGPRSLLLRRSASLNGFGFTLRHFIVYPPESYTVLAGDRRLGLRSRCIDEPMDTIFIKHVRPHSPAAAAGLVPGDRVVSVNGQTIADVPYADVVSLIQNSPSCLHLLVVPKENDLLQLYFGDTAHNPETNQRPPCPIYQNLSEVDQEQLYPASRRASEGSNCDNYPNIPRSRLSLDATLSDASMRSSDDSLIMSRIRRSAEQKAEFLMRPPPPPPTVISPLPPREFYSRAQKLQETPWPPPPPPPSQVKTKTSYVPPLSLSRITENNKVPSSPAPSSLPPQQTHPANFTIVSTRTKQFESGEVETDKTDLHRSELSRMSSKQTVPNVAVRRKEFEARSTQQSNSISSSCSSPTPPSSFISPPISSGNRTIPVGNSHLHCEPPSNFTPPQEDPLVFEDIGGLPSRNKVVRQDSYLAACKKPVVATALKEDSGQVRTRPRPNQLSLSPNSNARPAKMRHSQIPDDYLDQVPDIHVEEPKTPSEKSSHDSTDEEKAARRKSYLKATWGNHSDLELSDSEPSPSSIRRKSSCKDVTREGYLQVKLTLVDGKKASDRSWRQFYAVLIGTTLYLYKERRDFLASDETPASLDMTGSCERIDIGHNCVEVACDYTKRKHVLRLSSPSSNSELLLQADDTLTMAHWIRDLQTHAIAQSASESNISPAGSSKSRKLAASPRKQSVDAALPPSPKSKTWKGRVAKQFRRIQAGAGSPNSPNQPYPPGTNIGVPLQHCISSTFSEFVPLIVELCTNVVESKGLEIIGIYRVPGNTAAVSSLTEAVNKGLDPSVLESDPRWSDVNVISSLLKSFFRRLPDSLLTTELYPLFIQADKIEDPTGRITAIKKLVHELPEHHFQTLKYIMQHLKRVVDYSQVNKMEARNLAIVFGPTLVRAGDDNMVTMVTDMSHQCRIVEFLILNVDWCFGETDESPNPIDTECSHLGDPHGPANQSLLLNNIQKMEGIQQSVSAKDIVSSILFAANRKINRSASSSKAFAQPHASPLSMSVSTSKISGSPPSSTAPASSNEQSAPSVPPPHSPVAKSISQSVLLSGKIATSLQGEEDQEGAGSSGAITSYTGLLANTQERIRRFEQETLAMLQKEYKNKDKPARDLSQSKRDLDSDDKSVDSTQSSNELRPSSESTSSSLTSTLSRLSSSNTSSCTNSSSNNLSCNASSSNNLSCNTSQNNLTTSQNNLTTSSSHNSLSVNTSSLGVSPSPALSRSPRSPRLATRSSTTHMKRLKTGKELETQSTASGSSESLTQDISRSQCQQGASDEGSDLLTTLTSTFDQKLKLLHKSKTCIISSSSEPSEAFKDPSLHRTLDFVSNKSSDSESKDKENTSVHCNVNNNVNSVNNNVNVNVKEKTEEVRAHKTLRQTLSEMNPSECKLNRSSSLRKHEDNERKLKRTGSLNVRPSRSDSKIESRISKFEALVQNFENKNGVKRSDSFKSDKSRRTSDVKSKWMREKENVKMKRKSVNARSIRRRHTVGGTKDFDKVNWLQREREVEESKKERRTSSPDLSYSRLQNILSDVVMRPQSLLDTHFSSRLLESHV